MQIENFNSDEILKKFEDKNPNDLTDFMNGKRITSFGMSLDDRGSVITLELENSYIAKIYFPPIRDFTVTKAGN
jgi:predicted Zn-dependent protease with MMP-like domain